MTTYIGRPSTATNMSTTSTTPATDTSRGRRTATATPTGTSRFGTVTRTYPTSTTGTTTLTPLAADVGAGPGRIASSGALLAGAPLGGDPRTGSKPRDVMPAIIAEWR